MGLDEIVSFFAPVDESQAKLKALRKERRLENALEGKVERCVTELRKVK